METSNCRLKKQGFALGSCLVKSDGKRFGPDFTASSPGMSAIRHTGGAEASSCGKHTSSLWNLMRLKHAKILLTGKPGVGKTTLVRKVIEQMPSVNMAGFFTAEIRKERTRQGFKLQGLNGEHRILAHVDIDSRYRVGRYGVDTNGFEKFLAVLDLFNPAIELIVIDEIGKMELFSNQFRILVCEVLNSDKQVLATIPSKGDKFIMTVNRYLRVDGCKGGWFFVCLASDGELEFGVFSSFKKMYNRYSDAALILVDIPIGLPSHL